MVWELKVVLQLKQIRLNSTWDKLGQNDITHFLFCRISVMNQELVSEYSVGFAFIFSVNLSNENKVFFILGHFVSFFFYKVCLKVTDIQNLDLDRDERVCVSHARS